MNNKNDTKPIFILHRVNYTKNQFVHENVLNIIIPKKMKIKVIDIVSHSLDQLKSKYNTKILVWM